MSFRQIVPGLALVFSLVSTLAFAAPPEQGRSSGGGGGGSVLSLLPADAVSDHVLNADGKSIPYTATAGTLDLFGQDGEDLLDVLLTELLVDAERQLECGALHVVEQDVQVVGVDQRVLG